MECTQCKQCNVLNNDCLCTLMVVAWLCGGVKLKGGMCCRHVDGLVVKCFDEMFVNVNVF